MRVFPVSNQVPKCFCVEVTPEMNVAKWQQAAAATAMSGAVFFGAQSASAGPFTQSEIASLTSAREALLECNARAAQGKSRRLEK